MKETVEQLLPLIKTGKIPDIQIQEITDQIKRSIKEDPSKGKELGELFSRIRQAVKTKDLHTGVNWVAVEKGFLGVGHKPGGKISFEGLQQEAVSAVVTLLHENEGASTIGKQVAKCSIEWIWFPFSASSPHAGENIVEVCDLYARLAKLLKEGGKIYIHCSAGIHRTGMISYGLLRFLGKEKVQASELLQSLREVTATQVGEDRLVWGDQFDGK